MNEPADLSIAGRILDALADEDEARRAELDRLIAQGRGNVVPAKPAKEIPMAKCGVCGGAGHNARSCAKRVDDKPKPAPVKAAPAVKAKPVVSTAKALQLVAVKQASVEQLVATIEACRVELGARREQLRAQLDQVAEALGGEAV